MHYSDQISIENLGLSNRTFHALVRGRVFRVGDIKRLLANNNSRPIRFIGKKSLDEISRALDEVYKSTPPVVEREKSSNPSLSMMDSVSTDALDRVSIDCLQLPRAIRGSLKKHGIRTIGELRKSSDRELLNINRIGPQSLKEIRQVIAKALIAPMKILSTTPSGKRGPLILL